MDPEELPADREKAIEELKRGRELANQLKDMLSEPSGDDGLTSAADLVMKIMGSTTATLSILNSTASDNEISQIPAITHLGSPCSDGRNSEDSGDISKTSALEDRKTCHNRSRKTSQTWIKITPTLIDDGYAWRKYGQKNILNASYPRNYYRCMHKHDQGCKATKQVQRTDDNPCMYSITYRGNHTCRNLLKSSQIILDSTSPPDESSNLLSFGSNLPNNLFALCTCFCCFGTCEGCLNVLFCCFETCANVSTCF